jgi:hypothetical protein
MCIQFVVINGGKVTMPACLAPPPPPPSAAADNIPMSRFIFRSRVSYLTLRYTCTVTYGTSVIIPEGKRGLGRPVLR